MEFTTAGRPAGRAKKTSFWTTPRASSHDAADSEPAASRPASVGVGVGSLDHLRAVFWQCYRHLFPPHSLAVQTPNGSLVISWSVMDDPHARYPYAAPVMLRFDPDLVEAMARADEPQRVRIAHKHETTLRQGLRGYDPFARFPNARVVVIG